MNAVVISSKSTQTYFPSYVGQLSYRTRDIWMEVDTVDEINHPWIGNVPLRSWIIYRYFDVIYGHIWLYMGIYGYIWLYMVIYVIYGYIY